jgi:hypothetical protein
MKKISKEMILKYQVATQQYVDLIKANNGKAPAEAAKIIAKRNSTSTSLSTDVIRAGIVDRVSKNKYVVNIGKIEPIHARLVIEKRRGYKIEKKQKRKILKDMPTYEKHFKDTELVENPSKKRSISILWGLFKITY